MEEHPNAVLFRKAMESMKGGDFQAYMDWIADDVEWWHIGSSEPIRGKEALMANGQEQMGKWSITGELHDVVANDDHLIALSDNTATRDGKEFRYRTAEICHIRDGKVTHRWSFSDDTQAINEFFA
jgi:ketosteroid isomerase-like protein